jgi:RNA polymerase sigma factor (sigma-70 family)
MSPRVEPLRRRLDDRSFERLYRRHLPEVYRYVLRDVGNRADAEEVTQNAFLDAYRALGRGHTPEKPRAWLFGIAKNATRRRYRTLSRRPHEVELEHELIESVAEGERPQLEELRAAVGSLPSTHQQVLFLREIEGLTYAEIANRMDLSHAAVETLLFRARRSLRGRLEEAGIRPAAPALSRRRRLAGLAFLPPGLLRQLDRVALEAERSGLVLKTAAATAAVILGAGITVAVVPLGAAGEREQAVTMPKATTMPAGDTTLFTSVFSASANSLQDAEAAGATDPFHVSGSGSDVKDGAKDKDSAVQTVAGEATSLAGGSGIVQQGASVPAVSTPAVSTAVVSIPSVTTPPIQTPPVTAPALPEVDVSVLPDVPVTTGELPALP